MLIGYVKYSSTDIDVPIAATTALSPVVYLID